MTTSESGDAAGADETPESEPQPRVAVVLDVLPHGRADDDRPRYKKSPLAYALGEEDFRLTELRLVDDADVSIGDRVVVDPSAARESVEEVRDIEFDALSNTALSELDYVVDEILTERESRFVDFYNDAQPITIRLHQLNLLPGIGKKLRNDILDERKRGPFESFEDLEDRISGLHNPKDILAERIMSELRDDDLKYKAFVRRDAGGDGQDEGGR
jgi:putative nucleotide binding protein